MVRYHTDGFDWLAVVDSSTLMNDIFAISMDFYFVVDFSMWERGETLYC